MDNPDYTEVAKLLKSLKFFSKLELPSLEDLLPKSTILTKQTGEYIYKEGQQIRFFYVILSGSIMLQ